MRDFDEIVDIKESKKQTLFDLFHVNSNLNSSNVQKFAQRIDAYAEDKSEDGHAFIDSFPRKKKIPLGSQKLYLQKTLNQSLFSRRSVRSFSTRKVTFSDISKLMRLGYGKVETSGGTFSTIPSAGALYPLHIYMLFLNTELDRGVYHYYFPNEYLDEIFVDPGLIDRVQNLIFASNVKGTPGMYLCITADIKELESKYGERGYRFALIECGHLAQNLMIVAESINLKTVALGGYLDQDLAKLISINKSYEKLLYVMALGK